MKKNGASDIVISPRGAMALLRGGVESVAGGVSESAVEVDPVDRALMRAGMERALANMEDEQGRGAVMYAPDHGPTSLLQSFLAEAAEGRFDELRAEGKLVPLPEGGFEAKFDTYDLAGWAASFFTWWGRVLRKHPFLGPPEAPDQRIPNWARIALLGDWGSGRYGAPVCAATIQTAAPRHDLLLHLGDVYYSGTEREVQERFLDLWPEVPGALSRAVNSNHEMYSGGRGFFRKTLPAFGQTSSCFAVENDHFLLVGLDTAYEEHDLTEQQVPWLTRLVDGARTKGQKVVLFSHHQPFSAFEKQGGALVDKLRLLLEGRRIFAWYWGHEHRAALYERHESWGTFGRLVGHGGYPYFRDKLTDRPLVKDNPDGSQWRRVVKAGVPEATVLDGVNPYIPTEEHRYGPNGYMTLELSGGTIAETVRAPDGTVLYAGEIG